MPDSNRRRAASEVRRASRSDITIFSVGLVASVVSSVSAYGRVGPYGDGPINVGLYRATDPQTGEQLVYRDVRAEDGTTFRYFFDDAFRRLQKIQARRAGADAFETVGEPQPNAPARHLDLSNRTVERTSAGEVKTGFSLRGNGSIDAWEYRDLRGRLLRIEVSRLRDGKVDRWEYYLDDQLARVEQDENGDGKIDRWFTYEAGILVKEERDLDGDGRPDPGR